VIEENAGDEAPVVGSEVQAGSETLIDSTETAETQQATVQESAATTPLPATEPAEAELSAAEPEETAVVEPESEPAPEPELELEAEDTVDVTESSMAAESEAAEPEAAEPEAAEPEAAAPEAAAPEAAAGTPGRPERTAPTGSDKLQIIVHADTWGDVKDASKYQLVYDLLRADTSIELMGEAPFSVFLGNGHGVEILFNGEEIEITPKIRDDNTARLKIGG